MAIEKSSSAGARHGRATGRNETHTRKDNSFGSDASGGTGRGTRIRVRVRRRRPLARRVPRKRHRGAERAFRWNFRSPEVTPAKAAIYRRRTVWGKPPTCLRSRSLRKQGLNPAHEASGLQSLFTLKRALSQHAPEHAGYNWLRNQFDHFTSDSCPQVRRSDHPYFRFLTGWSRGRGDRMSIRAHSYSSGQAWSNPLRRESALAAMRALSGPSEDMA